MTIPTHTAASVGATVQRRMEHLLSHRSAERGTVAARLEDCVKHGGARLWELLKRHPSLGIAAAGGAGLAAATAVGVGEIVVAVTAAYAAYQVLREGVAPAEAIGRSIERVENKTS